MKLFVSVLTLFAATQANAAHFCERAVIRQVKEKLASQLNVVSVKVKSHGTVGEATAFTLEVKSTTRSGGARVNEEYQLHVDSACAIQGDLTAVPDSQVIEN